MLGKEEGFTILRIYKSNDIIRNFSPLIVRFDSFQYIAIATK